MDMTRIREAATQHGVLEAALVDIENRAAQAFSAEPEAGVLALWLKDQLANAPHLSARQPGPTLPAALQGHLPEQITWAREHGQVSVYDRERRRFHPTPPAELVAEWNKLPPIPRLTAQREWEAAQKQG